MRCFRNHINVNHLKKRLPCGKLAVVGEYSSKHITWSINVNEAFYLNVTFTIFKLEKSYQCRSSAVSIYTVIYATPCRFGQQYCGIRKPWVSLVPSHTVDIKYYQITVGSKESISMSYQVHSPHLYVQESRRIRVKRLLFPSGILTLSSVESYSFLVAGPLAHYIRMHISYFSGNLWEIYDGPSTNVHLASYSEGTKVLEQVVSRYHAVFVVRKLNASKYHATAETDEMGITFTYQQIKVNTISPRSSKFKQTVSHKHSKYGILHIMWLISSKHIMFPKLTFNVSKFTGYTDEHCLYRGFIIKHDVFELVQIRKAMDIGPICTYIPGGILLGKLNNLTLPIGDSYLCMHIQIGSRWS